jgi:hypothetical protein
MMCLAVARMQDVATLLMTCNTMLMNRKMRWSGIKHYAAMLLMSPAPHKQHCGVVLDA